MICGLVRWRLLKYSPTELASPPNICVLHHLNSCPACDSTRVLFLKLNRDVIIGGAPDPKMLHPLNIDFQNKLPLTGSTKTTLWRKLDWWLMPEKSIKWAFSIFAIIILGNLIVNHNSNIPRFQSGFPNNLVISRGHVVVTLSPEIGLHLSNTSSGSEQISGKGSVVVKDIT